MQYHHYTQIKNFEKIVMQKGGPIFHLSDCRLLNDPSEMNILERYITNFSSDIEKHMLIEDANVFKELIQKSEQIQNRSRWMFELPFILSLTNRYDSALYWNSKYAGSNGFALIVNDSVIKEYCNKCELFDNYRPVVYIDDHELNDDLNIELANLFTSMLNYQRNNCNEYELSESNADVIWATLLNTEGPFYKHVSWEHENEVRLVLYCEIKVKPNLRKQLQHDILPQNVNMNSLVLDHKYDEIAKFKTVEHGLLPYIEVQFPKNLIAKILLGPSNTKVNKEIIENAMLQSGYENPIVEISKCPIRSVG